MEEVSGSQLLWSQSSDFIIPPANLRVVSALTVKFILQLTLFNLLLWITAIVLQVLTAIWHNRNRNVIDVLIQTVLLAQMDHSTAYILVILATCWSVIIFVVTVASTYGLLKNRVKEYARVYFQVY